jgi:hypothetical protein
MFILINHEKRGRECGERELAHSEMVARLLGQHQFAAVVLSEDRDLGDPN